ncbi:hypothetical protein ACG83_12830 [Frankia sp. R43]|uniref:nuclear transport factor 2 family protein n=1 Tax=Frankia sp. R43 TaxID=269536 RepID=UPI0006CA0D6D|nr:nuclear transport factor 2 family protein [Frankia sp. R43]KPM56046.1 hypothetical protein ACG83_12830 [Frankia sp. R43]
MDTDPAASIARLRDRLAAAQDDRERAMLAVLERRVTAEIVGDLEALGAAVTPDFVLRSHPAGGLTGEGRDAFVAGFAAGLARAYRMLWMDWDHLAVDAVTGTIAADGLMRMVLRGPAAAAMYPGTVDDPSADYLASTPMAIYVTFRDGLIAREVTYADNSATVVTRHTGTGTGVNVK